MYTTIWKIINTLRPISKIYSISKLICSCISPWNPLHIHDINSLLPGDALWWYRSWSTLAQIMACCLIAPSHYLNHCWLLISKVLWHSPESNFSASDYAATRYDEFENYNFKISATSLSQGQCRLNMSVFQTCLTFVWRLTCNFTMDYIASSDKCLTFHYRISHTLQGPMS